ncbi:MAG: MFS transporter [Alphaproteobacteria bacterium]|nr:MFS transporter [Alphaproteobacteria bacterium]
MRSARPAGLDARLAAHDLLVDALERRLALDARFAAHPGLDDVSARDRAFVRNLVTSCLRWLGVLDRLIDDTIERPLPARARGARHVLRLGLTQLLILDTPPHAAVDGAVKQAEARRMGAYKGLINAVLRRLAREGRDRLAALDPPRIATPDWLWRRWCATYGEDTARAIAAAHLAEPPLDLTVADDGAVSAEMLGAAVLPTGALRIARPRGRIDRLPGYDEGSWWVQDAAAALPARLLGPVDGRTVIDACAAPGGKTLQLLAAGARVVAVERSAARLGTLRANLARFGRDATLIEADAATWAPSAQADAVLLDAPCSGTGTLRRNPDIAWSKRPEDVDRLAGYQARLLDAALRWLAPGGTLVYAVCSLEPEEGPVIVADALVRDATIERVPVAAAEIGGLAEAITAEGDVRTTPALWSDIGGLDGFYAARLRRRRES